MGLGYAYRLEIKRQFLKLSRFKKRLLKAVKSEYDSWNSNGKLKEQDPEVLDNIRRYWKSGVGLNWSDDKMKREAWSAAFISYLMKESGAGSSFKYSPSHSVYIRDSIQNRKHNKSNPFKGYRPKERKVEVGDIVCYPRQSGVNYDTESAYSSHCDIVTSIADDEAITVGGNVSNSVSKTTVPLKKGKIDSNRDNKGYFVVIKNEK